MNDNDDTPRDFPIDLFVERREPRTLDGKHHTLSEKNIEARTAVCAVCGPVRIRKRSNGAGNPHGWQCKTKANADKRRTARGRRTLNATTIRRRRNKMERLRDAVAQIRGDVCAICGASEQEAKLHVPRKARGLQLDHCHLTLRRVDYSAPCATAALGSSAMTSTYYVVLKSISGPLTA